MMSMHDLTICILSAVEPPLPECLKAVEAQEGGPYPVIGITGIAPLSRAFNQMLDDCESRFIVQIDGDLIAKPWAVQALLDTCVRHPFCYVAWGQLAEADFGLGGSVRCWRRWPLRLIRFRDRRCTDRDLHARIRWTGLRRIRSSPPDGDTECTFGTHRPRESDFSRFSKSRNDIMKWRYLGRHDLIREFGTRACRSHWLALGFKSGLEAPWGDIRRSKNAEKDWEIFQSLQRIGGRHAGGQGEADAQEGLRGFQSAGAEILP